MAKLATLTIGDTFDNLATLYAGTPSAPYDVSGAVDIKATVTSADGMLKYCQDVTLDRSTPGSDWTNGVIAFAFTPAITAEIGDFVRTPALARIETQVFIYGKKYTWTTPVKIVPGNIN